MARHLTNVRAPAGACTFTLFALAATAAAQDPAATPPLAQQPVQPPEPDSAEAQGEEVAAEREWVGGLPWWRWSRATGDLGDRRRWLEESGIEVGGGLTMDWGAAWHGGLRNRDSVMALADINVALDLETLIGLPRTLAFVDAYQIEGRNISNDIGDLQGVSNIASPNTEQIAEVWLETWLCDSIRVKAGKVDFNSEFAFSEVSGEFINSSAGFSPTIQAAPSYPNPATSVNVFWNPSEFSYIGVGVYDGAAAIGVNTGSQGPSGFFRNDESDQYFTILEAGSSWTGGNTWGSGRVALGAWYHGEQFTRFDGGIDRGTAGAYAILDQIVWRENPEDAEDKQGIGVSAMLGFADEDVAQVPLHVQAGVVWTGAIGGREDDTLGFLVTHAQLSSATGSTFDGDETVFELLYRFQVTPAMSLKPDLQYVLNPSGDPSVDDALVGMVRMELTF